MKGDKGQSEVVESSGHEHLCGSCPIQRPRQAAVNGDSSVDEASTSMDVDVGQGRPGQPAPLFLRDVPSNLQSVIQPYMAGTIGGLAIRQIIPYIMAFFAVPPIYVHAHNINY